MKWSPRIDKAIQMASILHKDEVRKGVLCPYIMHPMAVMLIVSEYTDDEDTLVASILHDTIEDTDYTFEKMEKDFGINVRDIVKGITIPKGGDWQSGRYAYIEGLLSAPQEALIISAADKLHNTYSMYSFYEDKKEQFHKEFGGSLEERIDVYQKIIDILDVRIDNPIVDRLKEEFVKYRAFLES